MTDPYQAPAAVESTIRSVAQKAARNDKSLSAQERIRLEYFHRISVPELLRDTNRRMASQGWNGPAGQEDQGPTVGSRDSRMGLSRPGSGTRGALHGVARSRAPPAA